MPKKCRFVHRAMPLAASYLTSRKSLLIIDPMVFTRFCLCVSIIFLFSVQNFGQTVSQTLRGRVFDADSKSPLVGVAVQIAETNYAAQTDSDGSFVIQKVSVGRYTLQFSLLGYGSLTRSEVLVEAAKETIVEVSLAVGATQLNEVTVRSQLNATPTNGLQTITNEQVKRYAGTFFDPARLAASFAGVAAANDQANALVIRGNSPNGLQYRLEGVEIVNPNQFGLYPMYAEWKDVETVDETG